MYVQNFVVCTLDFLMLIRKPLIWNILFLSVVQERIVFVLRKL